jgi:valyl-tRNA synthetase
VTEKYGTDAVRMALLQGAAPGTDIVLTEERMESSRAFANKIWNAARFLFLNMERSQVEPWVPDALEQFLPEPDNASLEVPIEDRWIFSRLNSCAEQVNRAIGTYRYHEAAQVLWHFFWHEFCDWYLEFKKLRFRENSGLDAEWRNTLAAFEAALRLLHPAMPFLTEELWQRLATDRNTRPVSIALATYPQYRQRLTDFEAEREIGIVQEIVTMARTLRTESRLDPKQQLEGTLYSRNSALEVAQRHATAIQKLANVKLAFLSDAAPKAPVMRTTTLFDLVLQVPQGQEEAQRKRMQKECEQLQKNIQSLNRQLNDQTFLGKAPANVIDGMRQKLADYQTQFEKQCGSV